MANELNLSASQFIVLAIILMLALAERAKNFGLDLEEAYNTMLAFSLENKLDCYPPQDRKKLESVLEFLMDATDMWMNGQIMVSSQERGVNEKK